MKFEELNENANLTKLAGRYGYELLKKMQLKDTTHLYNNNFEPTRENFDKYANALIKQIRSFDPSEQGLYTQWLITTYINDGIRYWEDFARANRALQLFHENKRRIPVKDIKRYTGLDTLEDIVEPFKNQEQPVKNLEPTLIKLREVEILYNDKTLKVVIPKTERASCYYGRNTRWCTAATDSHNYFMDYHREGPLIIVIDKPNNRRWQLHFESAQYMDEKDHSISLIALLSSFPKLLGVIQPYIKDGTLTHEGDNRWVRTTDRFVHIFNDQGQLHSEEGPAEVLIYADGKYRTYYKNGVTHRDDDEPAYIGPKELKWYKDGKLHRDNDKPAVIFQGDENVGKLQKWFVNGKMHRDNDLPAFISEGRRPHIAMSGRIEYPHLLLKWANNGHLHRAADINKPTIIATGARFIAHWHINGLEPQMEVPNKDPHVSVVMEDSVELAMRWVERPNGKPNYIDSNGMMEWSIEVAFPNHDYKGLDEDIALGKKLVKEARQDLENTLRRLNERNNL